MRKISLQKFCNLVSFVIGFPKSYKMLKSNDWNVGLNLDLYSGKCKIRHSGSMLEDPGRRYECPSYGLKCGACISLNSLRRILLKLSQKNDRGGG